MFGCTVTRMTSSYQSSSLTLPSTLAITTQVQVAIAPAALPRQDGKPALGKMAYMTRVKAFLKTRKAQNAAKRHWSSAKSVARIVIRKKGAASGK